jgi:hypothetical protein
MTRTFEPGTEIGIPCEVQRGPFSGEQLITLNTAHGPMTGFVKDSELKQRDNIWLVRGTVRADKGDTIEVWIQGSFFTTNGLANVPRQSAMAA